MQAIIGIGIGSLVALAILFFYRGPWKSTEPVDDPCTSPVDRAGGGLTGRRERSHVSQRALRTSLGLAVGLGFGFVPYLADCVLMGNPSKYQDEVPMCVCFGIADFCLAIVGTWIFWAVRDERLRPVQALPLFVAAAIVALFVPLPLMRCSRSFWPDAFTGGNTDVLFLGFLIMVPHAVVGLVVFCLSLGFDRFSRQGEKTAEAKKANASNASNSPDVRLPYSRASGHSSVRPIAILVGLLHFLVQLGVCYFVFIYAGGPDMPTPVLDCTAAVVYFPFAVAVYFLLPQANPMLLIASCFANSVLWGVVAGMVARRLANPQPHSDPPPAGSTSGPRVE